MHRRERLHIRLKRRSTKTHERTRNVVSVISCVLVDRIAICLLDFERGKADLPDLQIIVAGVGILCRVTLEVESGTLPLRNKTKHLRLKTNDRKLTPKTKT